MSMIKVFYYPRTTRAARAVCLRNFTKNDYSRFGEFAEDDLERRRPLRCRKGVFVTTNPNSPYLEYDQRDHNIGDIDSAGQFVPRKGPPTKSNPEGQSRGPVGCVEIEICEDTCRRYEMIEDGVIFEPREAWENSDGFREWAIPASVINKFKRRLVTDDSDADPLVDDVVARFNSLSPIEKTRLLCFDNSINVFLSRFYAIAIRHAREATEVEKYSNILLDTDGVENVRNTYDLTSCFALKAALLYSGIGAVAGLGQIIGEITKVDTEFLDRTSIRIPNTIQQDIAIYKMRKDHQLGENGRQPRWNWIAKAVGIGNQSGEVARKRHEVLVGTQSTKGILQEMRDFLARIARKKSRHDRLLEILSEAFDEYFIAKSGAPPIAMWKWLADGFADGKMAKLTAAFADDDGN